MYLYVVKHFPLSAWPVESILFAHISWQMCWSNMINVIVYFVGGEQTREGYKAIEALSAVYEHWIPKESIIKTNTWSSELSKLVRKLWLMEHF